ncbi:hypothetical protein ZEAMMB73_Zm00001d011168 [Zea mays]|uniref:Uncharacterized protein n=1 Tax=Zea mays TaxID=4577 RepID=A0A1D6FXK6_MAIZE|nr:hypothetical protein ZEAMMB73_Zm00001d011168 [Zea mays]
MLNCRLDSCSSMPICCERITTEFRPIKEVDVVFLLCWHFGSHLLDILHLEVAKNSMGCCMAPTRSFDGWCIEPVCGPCAAGVNARYQHIEKLHV